MKLLAKSIFYATTVTPTVAMPLFSLTSCGCNQSWGHLTPFSIGSSMSENGPFGKFGDEYLDSDLNRYDAYLQSNYSYKQSSGAVYAYSTPDKWNSDNHQWETGNSKWYTSDSSAFVLTQSYKDDQGKKIVVKNAKNAALSANIPFVGGIALTINNYISNALKYQASQIGNGDENISIAWGSGLTSSPFEFKHGNKGGDSSQREQNNKYCEYVFATAGLNGGGKAKAALKTSSVNFQFDEGFFPLPNYEQINGTKKLSTNFCQLLENHDDLSSLTYYSAKSKKEYKDDDGDTYRTYTYESVPIVLTVDDLTQTYVNPSKSSSSFLVNDYYSAPEQIRNTVGNLWKNKLPSYCDLDKNNAIPHYQSFSFKTSNNKEISLDSFGEQKDERLPSSLPSNSFIALLNYSVNYFENKPEKSTASINKLENLFPSYWLDVFKDENWFKDLTHDDTTVKVFNQKVINKKTTKFRHLIERTSGDGLKAKAKDISQESKNLLAFLGYLFTSDGTEINTNNFMIPLDEIVG